MNEVSIIINGVRYDATDEGTVAIASFYNDYSPDIEFFKICVTAWCKLSDIKPYKEETK